MTNDAIPVVTTGGLVVTTVDLAVSTGGFLGNNGGFEVTTLATTGS